MSFLLATLFFIYLKVRWFAMITLSLPSTSTPSKLLIISHIHIDLVELTKYQSIKSNMRASNKKLNIRQSHFTNAKSYSFLENYTEANDTVVMQHKLDINKSK